jgi:hypothetical protein
LRLESLRYYSGVTLCFVAGALWWFRSFLFSPGTPNFLHDWAWSPYAPQVVAQGIHRLSLFSSDSLGGLNAEGMTYAPVMLMSALATIMSSGLACKVFLVLCVAVAGVSATWLAFRVSQDAIVAPLIGAFYAFGPIALDGIAAGHVNAWAAYAALPAAVAISIGGIKKWQLIAPLALACAFVASQFAVLLLFLPIVLGLAWACGGAAALRNAFIASLLTLLTQALPATQLLLAAHDGGVGQPWSRIPWEVVQSAPPVDVIALSGYAPRYVDAALGPTTHVVYWWVVCLAALALYGLLMRKAVVLVVGAACLVAICSSFRTMLFPIASELLLRFPYLSIFRELHNGLEIVAAIYVVGLAAAARTRSRVLVALGTAGCAGFFLASSFGPVLRSFDLSQHASAAEMLAKAGGTSRIWPLPNGRFMSPLSADGGGFDPFFGRLGAHGLVEEYFSPKEMAIIAATKLDNAAPLLRAMNVGFVWIRQDWKWLPAGGGRGEFDRTCRGSMVRVIDTQSDTICLLAPLAQSQRVTTIEVVPDSWSAGVSSLSRGRDFVFARDAQALGITESPANTVPDDRRLIDPTLGLVSTALAPLGDARFSALAGPSVYRLVPGNKSYELPTGTRLVGTNGAIAGGSDVTAVGKDLYAASCSQESPCVLRNATYFVVGETLKRPVLKPMPVQLKGMAVLIDRSRFLPFLNVRVDRRVVPHFRVDGFANGWLVPTERMRSVAIDNDALPLLRFVRAVTLAAWLIILGACTTALLRLNERKSQQLVL